MAQNVTDWVWKHSRAVNGSLIVLLAIAHEANRDGITEMSVRELAGKARLSERAVQNAVADLVTHGELGVAAGGGRGRMTTYAIPVKGADSAPFEPGNPAESAPFEPETPVKGADSAPFEPETPQNLHPLSSGSVDKNPAESAPFTRHTSRSGTNPAESAPFEPVDNFSDALSTTTGRSLVDVKEVPAIAQRDDVERLCRHLADRIEGNGSKRPTVTKRWRDAARLMLDSDGRTEHQVISAIDWCQDHEFWRVNILSMPKLREKYDQLRLHATRENGSGHRPSAADKRVADAQALKARLAARKSQ